MIKNLSVAAILLAAAISASELPTGADFDSTTLPTSTPVTPLPPTTKPTKKSPVAISSSSSTSSTSSSDSSSSSSSSDSSSSDSSSSDSSSSSSSGSSSGSSSSSDSDSDSSSSSSSDSSSSSSDKKKVSISGKSSFSKKHGKKWLKASSKAEAHDIAVIRQKSKIDSKGKKHKKARKSDVAFVKNVLKIKSKKPVKVTVADNGIKKGLTVSADGKKLFKTSKNEYAFLENGTHEISVAANKKKVEGTASIKVEEVEVKKLNKKYKLILTTVKASDAQDLCERFEATLAEVKESDIAAIIKKAKNSKTVKASGVTQVWIDRVNKKEDETFSYFPTVLDLETGKDTVDPDEVYKGSEEYANKKISAIKYDKDSNKKKYKKALAEAESKIRKHMDKLLDGKDETEARAVLCTA